MLACIFGDCREGQHTPLLAAGVLTDEKGSRVVSCPTEDEAREYIREQEGSESDGN